VTSICLQDDFTIVHSRRSSHADHASVGPPGRCVRTAAGGPLHDSVVSQRSSNMPHSTVCSLVLICSSAWRAGYLVAAQVHSLDRSVEKRSTTRITRWEISRSRGWQYGRPHVRYMSFGGRGTTTLFRISSVDAMKNCCSTFGWGPGSWQLAHQATRVARPQQALVAMEVLPRPFSRRPVARCRRSRAGTDAPAEVLVDRLAHVPRGAAPVCARWAGHRQRRRGSPPMSAPSRRHTAAPGSPRATTSASSVSSGNCRMRTAYSTTLPAPADFRPCADAVMATTSRYNCGA